LPPLGVGSGIIPLPYAESDSDASVLDKKSGTFERRPAPLLYGFNGARTPPRSRYCRSGTRAGHPTSAWDQI